ncbi:YciI family protein [Neobacillus cucumis]|uniref:YciI family protein n=1 Tax=Neobacillus cucumis TaxID=1740721 RepID=UPI00203D5BE8|nr:YciI family protein [Neobacillus cucumis]MCM3728818.1 YciI family protein [Neobacillus cucumis]
MGHYAAILYILDPIKRQELRPQHLVHLNKLQEQGKIFAKGPFVDGSGGLVVYVADSLEEAQVMAEKDPYVTEKALRLELHEWKLLQKGWNCIRII